VAAGAAMGAAAQPLFFFFLRRADTLLRGEQTIKRMLEPPH
jgi:hypothetical protein